ncbi:MAG: serine/threonine protein kinase [Myxococcales bacterium]|nr:serine/threonine protein kinase [Myxococcales bacterium]
MTALLTEGVSVEGRYVLQTQLGEGTFGSVWRARDARLSGRDVAVKVLKPELLEQPTAVSRFDAEADALAQLSHPNIVAVLDRGTWEGKRYIVTEFVAGQTLSAWIEDHRSRGAAPELRVVAQLFEQICAAVEAAHRVRSPGALVHRDIKPENVIIKVSVDGERVAKLIDFGIAQLGRRDRTASGVSLGTPLYMAPEQAYGYSEGVGTWTDVFALGVVLVEMLTLRAQPSEKEPWWGAVIRDVDPLPLVSAWRPDVPAAVWAVVARCMRREGRERYVDAAALREAFRAALRTSGLLSGEVLGALVPAGLADSGARPAAAPEPVHSPEAHAATVVQAAVAEEAPLPWGLIALGVVLGAVLVAAAIVVALVRSDQARQRAAQGGASAAPAIAAAGGGEAPRAEVERFLRGWEALFVRGDSEAFSRYYAPQVRSHGRAEAQTPVSLAEGVAADRGRGATLTVDPAQSTWANEAVTGENVPSVCRTVPGATGPVLKVRAWVREYRADRNAVVGCARLEGVFLLRLRQTPEGLRICHESWSLEDGICASCPTASVCRGRGL